LSPFISYALRQAEKSELRATQSVDARSRTSYEAQAKLWRGFAEDRAAPDEPKAQLP
jgi:hypothetical protein